MKQRHLLIVIALCGSLNNLGQAQGTVFTYQGRLNDAGAPANGTYDLRFSVYDNSAGGAQQGPTLTNSPAAVSNGLFTVTLDFGNVFPGAARWLDIGVRSNGGGSFFPLAPRQALTPAPYAITAGNVISGGLAAGAYDNAVSFSNAANSFNGAFSGNGGGLTNVNAASLAGLSAANFWQLGGNSTGPGQFVGTVNNQPLELRANGERALRLEPVVSGSNFSNDVNVIGGSAVNFVVPGVSGATISGGGAGFYFGAPVTNSIAADFGVIGGGASIVIQTNAYFASIGGGYQNAIQNLAQQSTIAGGANNTIQAGDNDCTIGGGQLNVIQTNSAQSTIAGGNNNTVQYQAAFSTIGGGQYNTIQAGAYDSVISGGAINTNGAIYGTLGGGHLNYLYGTGSTLAGGLNNYNDANTAGTLSGGQSNQLGFFSAYSTIGGGVQNTNSGLYSVISGGELNNINFDTFWSVIGGGEYNSIYTGSSNATVAGGYANACLGEGSTVAGGEANEVGGTNSAIGGGTENYAVANEATIPGGLGNNAAGDYATIGGGADNVANGFTATVPGGINNMADGDYSFAAGTGAAAANQGCFVWADGQQLGYFASTSSNQFLIHANGGVGIGLNSPSAALHVASSSSRPELQITQNNSSDYARLRMNVSGYPSWEMDVSPGPTPQLQFWNGSEQMYIDYTGNVTATSFNPTSDRNAKENFAPVDVREVLDKVAALPITRWNFKHDPASPHMGPMAQDFRAAFGLGPDDKHIPTVDADGVALAAIQGLNQKLEAQAKQMKQKDAEIGNLKQRLDKLEQLLGAGNHVR